MPAWRVGDCKMRDCEMDLMQELRRQLRHPLLRCKAYGRLCRWARRRRQGPGSVPGGAGTGQRFLEAAGLACRQTPSIGALVGWLRGARLQGYGAGVCQGRRSRWHSSGGARGASCRLCPWGAGGVHTRFLASACLPSLPHWQRRHRLWLVFVLPGCGDDSGCIGAAEGLHAQRAYCVRLFGTLPSSWLCSAAFKQASPSQIVAEFFQAAAAAAGHTEITPRSHGAIHRHCSARTRRCKRARAPSYIVCALPLHGPQIMWFWLAVHACKQAKIKHHTSALDSAGQAQEQPASLEARILRFKHSEPFPKKTPVAKCPHQAVAGQRVDSVWACTCPVTSASTRYRWAQKPRHSRWAGVSHVGTRPRPAPHAAPAQV